MGATPRAIIITVPKIGGLVHSDALSRSKLSNAATKSEMESVQELENRLLLPTDLHPTVNDRRKKRLNHLSYEEKMHRKKLKNRVAAQTSRDRKKAKMDELERNNQALQELNARLMAECEMLRAQNARLTEENEKQQRELANRLSTTTSCQSCSAKQTSHSSTSPHTPGPAESIGSFPLLKGRGLWNNSSLLMKQMTSLVRICLLTSLIFPLSRTSWRTLKAWITSVTWRNWQRACLKMHRVLLMLKVQSHPGVLRWWGKHQKTWNPMERLPLLTMAVH